MNLYENIGADDAICIDDFSLKDTGYIVLLTKGDNLKNLSVVGLNGEGLISSVPEIINKINIKNSIIYEVIILYNNEFCMTFYVPEELCDKEIKKWINEFI